MSRGLEKQASFGSPGLDYDLGSSLEDDRLGKGRKALLNRSLTITGRPEPKPKTGIQSREPSSPLKRFARAKDGIRRAFQYLNARLEEAQAFMSAAREVTESNEDVATLVQRTHGIQEVLGRDRMKVAFFGRTSNGKSTVINALLHGRVLPVGIGHTTNCFCSIVGAESNEGYLEVGDSQEKHNVKVSSLSLSLYLSLSLSVSPSLPPSLPLSFSLLNSTCLGKIVRTCL